MTTQSLTGAPPVQEKWLSCNGQQLRKLAKAGLAWLDQNHQHVNALNVFPVPDGDTGTNMLLTMRSACNRVEDSTETHVGKMARQLSQGALMGARGNSGVILSQILRGLAKGLEAHETFDAKALAAAFQQASDTAYNGVMRPVEGTVLTVIREGADEAVEAAEKSPDLRFLMERVVERCEQALERTPEQLPILKQAGVVDSGGQGLLYIFEGMLRYVNGQLSGLDLNAKERASLSAEMAQQSAQALAAPESGRIENPYDVQFILMGEDLNVEEIRDRIDAMGDSTVVVGDETTVKVHIHVENPGEPLTYGISLGQITDVVVENMQLQMEEMMEAPSANGVVPGMMATPSAEIPEVVVEPGQIGVVAIAAGDGLIDIFRSLGAAHIVHGGQTNNPSTEEIYQAIQDVPTDKVVILPNNKNIILAAEAARDLSPKNVVVVPTRTAPQGISAMLALDPDGDLDATAEAMNLSSQQVATGELTRATRSVTIDEVDVVEGQVIGLANGKLCVAGDTILDVLPQVLAHMEMEDREIVSIYYGVDASAEEAEALEGTITTLYPDVEVEILAGGQAHYFFILGAE